jgi:uncharacterized protein
MLFDLNRMHGPRARVERTFEPEAFAGEDGYRVAAPVRLEMDVEKGPRDAFHLRGRVSTRLELTCSRCLAPLEIPVDAPFDLRYLPQTENHGEGEIEIGDDDLGTAYYREGTLDVAELIREQFQLALPMKPLCSEACRGLCPECGGNLNRTECGCRPTWEDPRLAALKGLLNRDKET